MQWSDDMSKIDHIILTNQSIMSKVENREWQTYKLFEHSSNDFQQNEINESLKIVEPIDVFKHSVSEIVKRTNRSFLKKFVKQNILVVYVIDNEKSSMKSQLIKETFEQAGYKKVFLTEIGPITTKAIGNQIDLTPVIVISKVESCIEFAFCFGGAQLKNRIVNSDSLNELNEFITDCKSTQKLKLDALMDFGPMNGKTKTMLREHWDKKTDLSIILNSNSDMVDFNIHNQFKIDYSIDFNQMAKAMEDLSGSLKFL